MEHAADGILLVDKGSGETSHGVVKKVRSVFRRGKSVKVGHAGTLDPFATGLLIILLGQGTKLSRFIMSGEKVYLATVELGVETDTFDPTGKVVRSSDVPDLSTEYIREKANRFVGKIHQVPPIYSAVRYKGERAYKLARRGQRVDLKTREVTVYALRILTVDLPLITMRVRCSSGTYIRSLAADLGRDLGPGGHLRSLRRLKSGPFEVEDALPSAEIAREAREQSLSRRVIPIREAIPDIGEIVVQADLAEKVRNGYQPTWEDLISGSERKICINEDFHEGWIKLANDGKLVAIMKVEMADASDHGKVKKVNIERVFSV
ncbi:MAG: tRNA pseudouridine(55) synthase TruB [Proteobacteria bacterium]|nr:tRNA pseudouridine(55) synthase TruB [Pseudomonadota bacterium]